MQTHERSWRALAAVMLTVAFAAHVFAQDPVEPCAPSPIPEPLDPFAECGSPPDVDELQFAHCVIDHIVGAPILIPDPIYLPGGPQFAQLEEDPKLEAAIRNEILVFTDYVNSTAKVKALLQRSVAAEPPSAVLVDVLEFLQSAESVVFSVQEALTKAILTGDCEAFFPGRVPCTPAGGDAAAVCTALLTGATPLPPPTDTTLNIPPPPIGDVDEPFNEFFASPYLPLPPFGDYRRRAPAENIFDAAIGPGGAHVTLKELFGLKLRLWYRILPVWAEPWYSRRHIVGYKKVWYLQWVPCEYIKSIIHNSAAGQGTLLPAHVTAREYCDTRLLGYWRWF